MASPFMGAAGYKGLTVSASEKSLQRSAKYRAATGGE